MSDIGELEFRPCGVRVLDDCYFRMAMQESGASPNALNDLTALCGRVGRMLTFHQEAAETQCPMLAIAENAHDILKGGSDA